MVTNMKILIALCYVILIADVLLSFYLVTRHNFRFAALGGIGALIMVALLGILHRYLRVQTIIESCSVPEDEDDEQTGNE